MIRETQSLRQESKAVDPTSGIGLDDDDNQLAYKDMSDVYYYVATIIYFAIIVAGSILIPSVDQIFEFIATISVNALGFIFPSVFYFVAQAKFPQNIEGKTKSRKWQVTKSQNQWMMISSITQIILGVLAFGFGMFNDIAGFIVHED